MNANGPGSVNSMLMVLSRNLTKQFPRNDYLQGSEPKLALNSVSLQMYDGQIFGLLGHNGTPRRRRHWQAI